MVPQLRRRALLLAAVVALELWLLLSERAAYEAVLFRAQYGLRALAVCYVLLTLLTATGVGCCLLGRDMLRAVASHAAPIPAQSAMRPMARGVGIALMGLGALLALVSLVGAGLLAAAR